MVPRVKSVLNLPSDSGTDVPGDFIISAVWPEKEKSTDVRQPVDAMAPAMGGPGAGAGVWAPTLFTPGQPLHKALEEEGVRRR